MEEKDFCWDCEIFKKNTEEALKRFNSTFDAAIEARFFTDECKKTCDKWIKNSKES